MPAIATEKKLRKMIEPLLEDGENITAVTFQGGLKKTCLAMTDNARILITSLPFFGSKAVLLNAILFQDIERIDCTPGTNYGFLSVRTDEEELFFKIASGLFDTFGEAMRMYTEVIKQNPDAAPEYLPDDENVVYTVAYNDGVIKLTDNHLLLAAFDKKSGRTEVATSIPAESIRAADFFPSKLTASFFQLRTDSGNHLLKLSGGLSGRKSILESLQGKASLGDADELFARILEMNPNAHPEYMEYGEHIIATARVGHGMFTVTGGNLLRATGSRLLELDINKDGPMTVKNSIPFDEIRESKLTTVRNQNSVQFELKIRTDSSKYKFVAPDDYEEAMNAIYEVLPG